MRKAPGNILVFTCDVCGSKYEDRPHYHPTHRLHLYGNISCCDSCWNSNGDGWSHQYDAILIGHLDRQGISHPKRNTRGFLPRD